MPRKKYDGPYHVNMPRKRLWKEIDKFCPKNMLSVEWHRTHDALRRACEYLSMQLVTTKSELDAQPTVFPNSSTRKGFVVDYFRRSIVLRGSGGVSLPSAINNVLSGNVHWDGAERTADPAGSVDESTNRSYTPLI
jgi:hypothetical protein